MMTRGGSRLHRYVILPFSIRCDSESSVAVAHSPKHSKSKQKNGSENLKIKKNHGLSRPLFSQGIHRLIRRFKSFSQFFVYKETEHMEKEMEIGFPTDVKHVTHIGLDGSTTTNNQVCNWENLQPTQILSFPSISLKQFESAMAAQSQAHL